MEEEWRCGDEGRRRKITEVKLGWKLNEALIEATDAKLKQEQEQEIALE